MEKTELLQKKGNVQRNSNFELFRILTMLVIVAHHYVVNSGLILLLNESPNLTINSIFLMLFGWGGKTGINCFLLITGYYMCKSNITLRKFLKLFLEVEFYKIVIYLIFLLSGYEEFSLKGLLKSVTPFYSIGSGFSSSYLVFYLFIPFLNILVQGMNEKQHKWLIGLTVLVYSILPTFIMANVRMSYIGWFMIIYLIASYFRLHPKACFENKKIWKWATIIILILSWVSVLLGAWIGKKINKNLYYYFVSDSNKILALATAVCAFLYFKNMKPHYNKLINIIAASSFGVLLIHANSDTMRQFLWRDLLQNIAFYDSNLLILHAIGAVIGIYTICTAIDYLRIHIIENNFFKWYDKIERRNLKFSTHKEKMNPKYKIRM